MKNFFKNWKDASPFLYYGLRFYVLYEIARLVTSSNRGMAFKIIITILIACLEFQWFISKVNDDN